MKDFWNQRYAEAEFAYGETPNHFFKNEIDKIERKGKALFIAEGEGRNAVYAATKGWEVFAYDWSEEGKKKAMQLAEKLQTSLVYEVGEWDDLNFKNEKFDLIVFIFAQLPEMERRKIQKASAQLLQPGGKIILEAYRKEQLEINSKNPAAGGPKNLDFLLSKKELEEDFKSLNILALNETTASFEEGKYHRGEGAVVQMIAVQP
ncbi:MAG: class I SAM-dependent methyltransferase [Flavobacteriales bacterium]|nr:class I SAM-dependent methyltransferase [Flavobacteriales bacterium]